MGDPTTNGSMYLHMILHSVAARTCSTYLRPIVTNDPFRRCRYHRNHWQSTPENHRSYQEMSRMQQQYFLTFLIFGGHLSFL